MSQQDMWKIEQAHFDKGIKIIDSDCIHTLGRINHVCIDKAALTVGDMHAVEYYNGNSIIEISDDANPETAMLLKLASACSSTKKDQTDAALIDACINYAHISKKEIDNNILVYDDYAHHPTEIKSTLAAAKQKEHKRIIAVFQPHTFSRTKLLIEDFIKAGSKVCFIDIDEKGAKALIDKYKENILYFKGDISEECTLKDFYKVVKENYNKIQKIYKFSSIGIEA